MAEERETEGGPLQKADKEKYLTYTKWGLMGIGGLFVLKLALNVIFNPVILVAGAAAAGAGWWFVRKRGSSGEGAAAAEATEGAGESASVSAVARSTALAVSPAVPAASARRERAEAEAEAELDAMLGEPAVAEPQLDALDEFERRLQQLEQLKAKMEQD